jgi:hypothetical protein
VDIKPKIEFFFHSVCLLVRIVYLERSGTLVSRPFVRLCSITLPE